MTEGQRVKIVLPNNIYYNGKIISEDEFFIIIIDKFGNEVRLGKNSIVSMEVIH